MTELVRDQVVAGRYRLERPLGAGGMASVWLARDAVLDRPVAVKLISDALALDPAYVERFAREARIAARLSHPHLVQVHDFGTNQARPARPFLVMEHVAGGTLADALAGGARVDAERLARELLDALAHVHTAGIVHRDVKPANVLLGADGRARLTDFGIAQPGDATRLTRTGNVVGTLRYLAPEVAAGEPATPRSDLYALGVLLGDLAPGPRLAELVQALTAPDPARRPPPPPPALATLDRWEPTAPTRVQPRPKRARVEPRVLAFVGLALVVIVVAIVAGATGGHDAPRPAARPLPVAPPTAPLGRQLDTLDRAVRAAAR